MCGLKQGLLENVYLGGLD